MSVLDHALMAWYGHSDVSPDKRERMQRTLEAATTPGPGIRLGNCGLTVVSCETCGELVSEYAMMHHRLRHTSRGETP